MTTPTMIAPAGDAPTQVRAIELVLAHMHLRLASLALARVELETLAGLGGLDTQGLVDLAEVRWRTGDLVGAGEAAAAALRADDVRPDPIALIVAAEAASAMGRPSEARRLATRAVAAAPHSLDEIFAGMPRAGVWVPDSNEPLPTAPTLFDHAPESPSAPERPAAAAAAAPAPQPAAVVTQAQRDHAAAVGPMTIGFWDGDGMADPDDSPALDPAREFEAGRRALVAGAFDEAALRLGLALRLAPALAPAVLEATEGARAASLSVVRGDAYRSAGHETEARQAYAIAALGGLPERRATVRVRPRPAPVAPEPDDGDGLDAVAGVDAEAEAPDGLETNGSAEVGDRTLNAAEAAEPAHAAHTESGGGEDR